jgi:hypothetical protein
VFLLGVFEVAAAPAPVTPATPALIAAILLALITAASIIFRLRRQQSAAPTIAVFLMVLLVIIGRRPPISRNASSTSEFATQTHTTAPLQQRSKLPAETPQWPGCPQRHSPSDPSAHRTIQNK